MLQRGWIDMGIGAERAVHGVVWAQGVAGGVAWRVAGGAAEGAAEGGGGSPGNFARQSTPPPRELELLSQQAYSVHRESELADRTMPDVRAETPRHMATLELKVAEDRTVESLLSDLEWQLTGDYLRDKKSNHGIFVVMHQGTRSRFSYGKRMLSFEEVRQVLVNRSVELTEESVGKKHVEVIAFECPSGHSPRNVKKQRRGRSVA